MFYGKQNFSNLKSLDYKKNLKNVEKGKKYLKELKESDYLLFLADFNKQVDNIQALSFNAEGK